MTKAGHTGGARDAVHTTVHTTTYPTSCYPSGAWGWPSKLQQRLQRPEATKEPPEALRVRATPTCTCPTGATAGIGPTGTIRVAVGIIDGPVAKGRQQPHATSPTGGVDVIGVTVRRVITAKPATCTGAKTEDATATRPATKKPRETVADTASHRVGQPEHPCTAT